MSPLGVAVPVPYSTIKRRYSQYAVRRTQSGGLRGVPSVIFMIHSGAQIGHRVEISALGLSRDVDPTVKSG